MATALATQILFTTICSYELKECSLDVLKNRFPNLRYNMSSHKPLGYLTNT